MFAESAISEINVQDRLNHDVIKWQRALYCSSITNNSNSENKICSDFLMPS